MKKTFIFLILILPFFMNSEVYKLKVEGPIDTISEEYIANSFKKIAANNDALLIVLEMDTPGGFDISMRSILKNMLNSSIPVAVYVSPKGARAASAGFFITIAADIAAMAPGTNMGAAHPVAISGQKIDDTMKEKITNDAVSYIKSIAKDRGRNLELAEKAVRESKSYTAEECLQNNLIDFIASDLNDLLQKISEKKIKLANGKTINLDLKNQQLISINMSTRQKFLRTITNPNLAYFLLIFGLIGLYIEFTHPGGIIPGVLGGISLLLAFLAFKILPLNYVGLFLIVLSIGFFIAEIKIQGFGILGFGGIISFLLGSIMLINAPIPEMRPAMSVIIVFTICFGGLFLFLTFKVIKIMKKRAETGKEGLTGKQGVAKTKVNKHSGKVFVHGEWWNAYSDQEIAKGSSVEVESLENFTLKVKKTGG